MQLYYLQLSMLACSYVLKFGAGWSALMEVFPSQSENESSKFEIETIGPP
jgi:hypothetical protein